MESISLAYFIDYMLTSGTGRVTSVQQLKRGTDERFSDFYRPVREAIVDMHQKGLGPDALDDLLTSLVDPREKRIFPKVVSGYKKFARAERVVWFEPPLRDYPIAQVGTTREIGVRITPELGLLIDGRPCVFKLYLRGDPISPQRVMITNALLSDALAPTWPGVTFGVLDVRRSKVYPYRSENQSIRHLIRAEAASLASLWDAL